MCVCLRVLGLGSGAWSVCVYLLTVCLVATAMTSWHTTAERRKECPLYRRRERRGGEIERVTKDGGGGEEKEMTNAGWARDTESE